MFSRKCLLSSINFQHKFHNATSSSPSRSIWRNYTIGHHRYHKSAHHRFLQNVNICNFMAITSPKHRQENKIHNLASYSSGLRQYSAQNLFRLTETSASQLQPYLDVNNIIKIQDVLQDSINKRQLTRKQVKEVKILFHKAQAYQRRKETAIQLKEENTTKYQALSRAENGKEVNKEKLLELKEQGRLLRDEVRAAEAKFNEVNDSLVDFVLSIPNILDKETPASEAQLLKEVVPTVKFEYDPEYTAVETQCGPGLLAEFPIGKAAWLDIDLRGRAQAHLLNGGFVETGNAEYVKRLILQGAGMDESQFLRIREPNVKKGWEHATYLAGGASFPSFLALFAQSIIEDPKILPIRYFVIGRSYESQKTKPGFYQSHVVQAFVACRNEEEMEKEFNNLQNLMESFYSEKVGFDFQTQMVPAPRLQMYERKKLAFVMNKTDKSASKMIGTLSTVGDYVSKRLLCCYFDEKKKTQFLHLISAKFFDITHFLRSPSPKLITHSDILAKGKPSPEMLTFENDESQNQRQP